MVATLVGFLHLRCQHPPLFLVPLPLNLLQGIRNYTINDPFIIGILIYHFFKELLSYRIMFNVLYEQGCVKAL